MWHFVDAHSTGLSSCTTMVDVAVSILAMHVCLVYTLMVCVSSVVPWWYMCQYSTLVVLGVGPWLYSKDRFYVVHLGQLIL